MVVAERVDNAGLAVSEVSRGLSREGSRNSLNDLKDSGGVEQDANLVMFLRREEY